MKRCLLLISLLWVTSSISAQYSLLGQPVYDAPLLYRADFSFQGKAIGGLCILKHDGEKILGSVVNEFGIKAFDFTFFTESQKVRLHHVVDFMDKWYICKVIRKDLAFLFSARESLENRNRKVLFHDDGSVQLENKRYQIIYKFYPVDNDVTK